MVQSTSAVRQSTAKLLKHEKIRFVLVGVVNTLVDFGVLFTLVSFFAAPKILANIVSTTCAMIVSYGLNKKSVFKDTDPHNYRQVALFVVVTLSGLWILQSVVITALLGLLSGVASTAALVVAKLVATVSSLIWNYLWYSKVIFRKNTHEKTD